jgi:hypothetical protein
MNLVKSKEKTNTSLEEREHTLYTFMIITSITIIIVNYIFYYYFKLDNTYLYILSVLFTLVLPFLLNMYSIFWHIHYHKTVSEEEARKEIEMEMKREGKSQIPVILFGIGIFITKLNEKLVKHILPYLMFALAFGSIIPEITNFLIFDYNDIKRITIAGEIDFTFIVMSYGFLIMSILLTIVFYVKNK